MTNEEAIHKVVTEEELFDQYSQFCQFEEGPSQYLIDKEDFLKAIKEYARIKCLETANKVKSECCKILDELPIGTWHTQSLILNIPDKDILPEI